MYNIGGWGVVQPGNRIRFVRACVRAKICGRAGRCCFRGWAAEAPSVLRGGVSWRVPLFVFTVVVLLIIVKSMLIIVKSMLNAFR